MLCTFPLFLLLPTHFYLPPLILSSPTSHTPLVHCYFSPNPNPGSHPPVFPHKLQPVAWRLKTLQLCRLKMVFFRVHNIHVPSPNIRVVRFASRYPEGVRSAEVRKGVFYDDNDSIFVIHRRDRRFWSYLHWILPTIYCCILFWNYSVVTALFCFVFF